MKLSFGLFLWIGALLTEALPESRFRRDSSGNETWKEIFSAAHRGDVPKIEELLKDGTDINIKDKNGVTPLFTAAMNGRLNVVEFLIKNEAAVNEKNNAQQAPIYTATFEGHERVVEFLLEHGADVNAREKDGWTPMNVVAHKNYERMAEILLKHGANPNNQNSQGSTPLFVASNYGRDKLVELLLRNGANVNLKTNNGQTPLYTAVFEGFDDIVEILLRNQADVNAQERDGWTPLHVAVQKGFERSVDLLLRNGADITIKNNAGDTPMDIGLSKGNEKIIELLKTVRRVRPAQKACDTYLKLPIDRIVQGELAESQEFPWMAALGYIDVNNNYTVSFDCGGTVISEFFILTAAHCVKSSRQPVLVRLGKVTLFDNDPRAVNRQIKDIIRHPYYSIRTKKNDIALIQVTKSIKFTVDVLPACLQIELTDISPTVKMIVSGWGSTMAEGLNRTNVLRKAELTTVPLSKCNASLVELNERFDQAAFRDGLIEGQYCAYDPEMKSDSCQGDSGGPLQYFPAANSTLATLVGVVSFGLSCATDVPGIYTRVAYYLDWIEAIVWPSQLD